MGSLARRYWIPALLSEEIPKPDCPPVRVRILGEELVAFRDSQGRIGLPGSRSALTFGRSAILAIIIFKTGKFREAVILPALRIF